MLLRFPVDKTTPTAPKIASVAMGMDLTSSYFGNL